MRQIHLLVKACEWQIFIWESKLIKKLKLVILFKGVLKNFLIKKKNTLKTLKRFLSLGKQNWRLKYFVSSSAWIATSSLPAGRPPPAPSVQLAKSLRKPLGTKSAQITLRAQEKLSLNKRARGQKGRLGRGSVKKKKKSTLQGKEKLSVKICVIRRFPPKPYNISMFSWSWSRSGGGCPGGDHDWKDLKEISSNEKASISCCPVEIQACLSSKVPKPRSTSFSDGLWSVTETQVMGWLLKWASLLRCLISHRLNLSALYRHSLERDED